ncbi:MAG TPA: ANTAR domain-containing protein [Kineosporiaceae bacterium]|nr:ANTAR domain-containing protein [Kineosporiaceae bacterium]
MPPGMGMMDDYQAGSDQAHRTSGSTAPGGTAPDTANLVARFEAMMARVEAEAEVDDESLPDRLCRAVADVLGVDGTAISVYLGADIAVPVGSNHLAASVGEALQFTVREGPCFEAYGSRLPVLVPDVDSPESSAWARWPTYAAQLTEHTNYHGVFAYPLLADGVAMGSLSLFRRVGGRPDYLNDVEVIATRVADRLLAAEIFTGPDSEPVHRWMEGPNSRRRRLVWLAQGLTLQANRITPAQAMELLRAQAFSADRLLDDLAADIVSGEIAVPVLESHQ